MPMFPVQAHKFKPPFEDIKAKHPTMHLRSRGYLVTTGIRSILPKWKTLRGSSLISFWWQIFARTLLLIQVAFLLVFASVCSLHFLQNHTCYSEFVLLVNTFI